MKTFIFIQLIIFCLLFGACVPQVDPGRAALQSNNFKEARDIYAERLFRNPADNGARTRLGFANLKLKNFDRAEELLTMVSKSDPEHTLANYYLGLAQISKGNYKAAIATWRTHTRKRNSAMAREIKQQLTIIDMIESRKAAQTALSAEQRIGNTPVKPGTLAVFPYAPTGDDPRQTALAKAMAAMTITDLAKVGGLKIIERVRVQALIDELHER